MFFDVSPPLVLPPAPELTRPAIIRSAEPWEVRYAAALRRRGVSPQHIAGLLDELKRLQGIPGAFHAPAVLRPALDDLVRYAGDNARALLPGMVPVVIAGGSRSFDISPAVSGKTIWDLDVDGPMTISTAGTWTFTPSAGFLGTVELWGPGGGGGSDGGTDADGVAGSPASTFAGLTANPGGGGGGGSAISETPGSGGTATGGDTNQTGTNGSPDPSGTGGAGGAGAGTGGGAGGAGGDDVAGNPGTNPGGGGGGGDSGSGTIHGNGGGGGGKTTKTYGLGDLTAGSPITLTIGVGGAGGAGGAAGGAGADGRFVVT